MDLGLATGMSTMTAPHSGLLADRARTIAARVSRRRLMRGAASVTASVLALASVRTAAAEQGSETAPEEAVMEVVVAPDGTRIAAWRTGTGPPLVLVHGTADDHTIWTGVSPALRERFTVYALDRRGRGGSGAYDAPTYDIEDEFADVAAVVDAIGEPTSLLGHSYGALCALEGALRTDNLRKLVLYEPPILIGEPFVPPEAVTRLETLLAAGDWEEVLLTFAREFAQVPEEAITAMRATPEWQASVETAPTIVAEVRAVKDYLFDPARFRELTTPTLLLLGSESPPYLKTATEAVAETLPQDRLTILAGQGHLAMYTAPERFLEEVIAFLIEDEHTSNEPRAMETMANPRHKSGHPSGNPGGAD